MQSVAYFDPQTYPTPAAAEGSDGFPREFSFTASDWCSDADGYPPLPVVVVSWPSTEYPELKSRLIIAPFVPDPTYEAETVRKTKRAEISDDGYCSECGEHWLDIGKHPAIDGYEWSEESVRKALDRNSPEECWNCYALFTNLEDEEDEFDYYTDMVRQDVVDAQTVKKYIDSIHDGYFAWWSDLDDLEFTLQKVPLTIWDNIERSEVDGQWIDAPVSSYRLSDTLQQFRNQHPDDDYPPVVLALNKSGNYEVIDGFHRLNALQILGEESVMAWVGTPVVDKKTKKAEEIERFVDEQSKETFVKTFEDWSEKFLAGALPLVAGGWGFYHNLNQDEPSFKLDSKRMISDAGGLDASLGATFVSLDTDGLSTYVQNAIQYVENLLLNAQYAQGKLKLYRGIDLVNPEDFDPTGVGESWTPVRDAAISYFGNMRIHSRKLGFMYDKESEFKSYVLTALVPVDSIDWYRTVLRALAFSHLEQDGIPLFDEKEIVLKTGAPIELVDVPLDLSFAIDGTPEALIRAAESNDGKALFRSKYDKVLNDYLTYNPYTDREEWLEDIQWLTKHDDEGFLYTLKDLGEKKGKNLDSITHSEYLAMWASPRDPLILEAAEIMIDRMLNHVDDLLDRADYRDGKILLYREITLEEVAHYDTTKLGVYWTPNIMAAQAHWGYGARSNNPYLIRAWVSFDDIDWNATWRANLHLPYECEFQLKSQVAVEVLPLTKRMSGNFVKRHPQTGLPIVSLDVVGPVVEPETLVYEVDSPIKDLLAVSEAGPFELIEALKDLPPELQRLTGVLELEDQPTRTGFASEQIFDYVSPQETVEWGFLRSSDRKSHPEGYVAQRYKNWSAPITGDLLDSFLENSLYHGTTEKAWELTQRKGYFTPREPFESGAKTGKQSLEGKNLMRQIGTYVTPVAGHAWQYAVGDWGPGSSKDRPMGGAPLVLKINPDLVRDLPWFIDLRDRAPSFFTTGRIPVEAVERVIEVPAEWPQRGFTTEPFSWYEHPMMPLINQDFDDPNPSYLKDKPKAWESWRFWQEAIFEPGFLEQQSFEEKQRRVETFTGRPYETVEPCSCPDDKTYSSSDGVGKVWLTHPRKYGRTVPEGEHRVQLQTSYPGYDQEQKFWQEWWEEFNRQLEEFYITQMGLTPAEFRLLMQTSEDDESVAAFIRSENMGEPYDFNLWTRWWPKPQTPEEVARPYQDHTLEELMEGYRTGVGDWKPLRREKQIRYTQLLSRLEWASESLDRTVGEAWDAAKQEWEDMVAWSISHNYEPKSSQDLLDVTAEEFEQALQYWNRISRVARRVGESGTVLGLWGEDDVASWSAYADGETLLRLVGDETRARFEEDVFEQYRQTGYINLAFYYFVLRVVLDLQWWLEDAWSKLGVPSRLATLEELLRPQSEATSVTAYRWVMAKHPQLRLSGGLSIPYGVRKGARGWSYGSCWSLDPKAFTRTDVWNNTGGSWDGEGQLDQYLEKQVPVAEVDWLGTLISSTLFQDYPEYEIIPAPGTFLAEEEGLEEIVEYPVRLYHGTSLAAWEAIQDEGEMRAWSCFASDYGYGINMPETYIDLAIGEVPDTDEDRLRQGVVLELVFETEEEANQYLAPDMMMYDLGMAYLEDDLYDKYGLESGVSSPWDWFQERFPALVEQNKGTSKLPRLPSSDEDWQSSYLSVYAVALKRPVPASRLRRVE